jgi:hypothetical protein
MQIIRRTPDVLHPALQFRNQGSAIGGVVLQTYLDGQPTIRRERSGYQSGVEIIRRVITLW